MGGIAVAHKDCKRGQKVWKRQWNETKTEKGNCKKERKRERSCSAVSAVLLTQKKTQKKDWNDLFSPFPLENRQKGQWIHLLALFPPAFSYRTHDPRMLCAALTFLSSLFLRLTSSLPFLVYEPIACFLCCAVPHSAYCYTPSFDCYIFSCLLLLRSHHFFVSILVSVSLYTLSFSLLSHLSHSHKETSPSTSFWFLQHLLRLLLCARIHIQTTWATKLHPSLAHIIFHISVSSIPACLFFHLPEPLLACSLILSAERKVQHKAPGKENRDDENSRTLQLALFFYYLPFVKSVSLRERERC